MHICVIGVGYVGLVTGTCFAELGIKVICVDNDARKIDMLEKGNVPIFEPGLEEMVAKNMREKRLSFTTDLKKAVDGSQIVFIAVGTPQGEDGAADLQYVWAVAENIGQALDSYKVIVNKSTVPVGTGRKVADIISKNLKKPVEFEVVSNPEFLREGSAIDDFMRPNRVVIGVSTDRARNLMQDLYSPLALKETTLLLTGLESAETIKYASNAFLATKISFINEMSNFCELVGADVSVVAKGMGLDVRIGSKFLQAGPGYGGSCFPKDTAALATLAAEKGYRMRIVEAAMAVNRDQRQRMVDKIIKALGEIKGKTIAVLGLTFKPNTDDMRDAPSLVILPALQKAGALIQAYDPEGMPEAKELMPGLKYCQDTFAALKDADAMVLMTEWNQFLKFDWQNIQTAMPGRVVIDLRNVYNPEQVRAAGFAYHSVGRS